MKIEGTVALITGAARRVGRAIALELSEAGCDIIVHYRTSSDEAAEVARLIEANGRSAVALQADLNDPAALAPLIERAAAAFGRLDVLVNNASAFAPDPRGALFDQSHWEAMLQVNLLAPVALAQHARGHLAVRGRGRIVNLVDIAAERPWPTHLAYCTSKAGLAAATRSLARAFAPDVRVNGVAPGIAVFPESYPLDLREKLVNKVPLRREGTASEVAQLVRFLVESGDYVTGEIIAIDGGRRLV